MKINATIHVDDKNILKFYNNPALEKDIAEEVEDYIGDERPFKNCDIPQLVSYTLLGENELCYVEID